MTSVVCVWTIALLSFALPAHANSVHGIFRVVKGDVKVKSAKNNETKPARLGDKVFPKDTIITGKDSRAKVIMTDKNEINVSPDSQVVFANYEFKPEEGKKEVLLDVLYGKVRSKVNQKYENTQGSKFQVRTPSAVAGVRGTDFLTSYAPANRATQVITFEGKVDFGIPGLDGSIKNSVSVTPNTTATSVAGQPPAAPAPVPPQQMAVLDRGTDAEKAPAGPQPPPGPEGRRPAQDNKPNEPKNEGPAPIGPDASAPPAPGAEPRGPASVAGPVAPLPPVGSMFDPSRDLPTGDFQPPPVFNLPGGALPPSLVGPPRPDLVNNCDFCRDTIVNGNALLRLNVVNGP